MKTFAKARGHLGVALTLTYLGYAADCGVLKRYQQSYFNIYLKELKYL